MPLVQLTVYVQADELRWDFSWERAGLEKVLLLPIPVNGWDLPVSSCVCVTNNKSWENEGPQRIRNARTTVCRSPFTS